MCCAFVRKGFVLVLSVFLFAVVLSACSMPQRIDDSFSLQERYFLENDFDSPDIQFDLQNRTWNSGPGRYHSHFISGDYVQENDIVTCSSYRWNVSIKLRLIGDDQLEIISVDDRNNAFFWLKTGDILSSDQRSPENSAGTELIQ